jgi:hypothetical protein
MDATMKALTPRLLRAVRTVVRAGVCVPAMMRNSDGDELSIEIVGEGPPITGSWTHYVVVRVPTIVDSDRDAFEGLVRMDSCFLDAATVARLEEIACADDDRLALREAKVFAARAKQERG